MKKKKSELTVQTHWNGRGYQCEFFGREGVTSANCLEGKGLPVQIVWKGRGYQCKRFGMEGVTSANSLEG